jgi:hypothetical protein
MEVVQRGTEVSMYLYGQVLGSYTEVRARVCVQRLLNNFFQYLFLQVRRSFESPCIIETAFCISQECTNIG